MIEGCSTAAISMTISRMRSVPAAVGHEDLDFSRFNLGQGMESRQAAMNRSSLSTRTTMVVSPGSVRSSFPRMKDMRCRAI